MEYTELLWETLLISGTTSLEVETNPIGVYLKLEKFTLYLVMGDDGPRILRSQLQLTHLEGLGTIGYHEYKAETLGNVGIP